MDESPPPSDTQQSRESVRIPAHLRRAVGGGLSPETSGEEPAQPLPELDSAARRRIDHWLQVLQRDHPDLQAHFSGRLGHALTLLEIEGVDAWMTAILDRYDKRGLGAAIEAIANLDAFAEDYRARQSAAELEDLEPFLEKYLTGLGGRPLRVTSGKRIFTDTESIYLPALLNVFAARADNETLYKLTAVYHWAQNRYGGWRLDALERLLQLPDLPRALPVFATLESLRLEARLALDFPGVCRELRRLDNLDEGGRARYLAWSHDNPLLLQAGAGPMDSMDRISANLEKPLPARKSYHGEYFPETVMEKLRERVKQEKHKLQQSLARLGREQPGAVIADANASDNAQWTASGVDPGYVFTSASQGPGALTLLFGEQDPVADDGVKKLLVSIIQDLGRLPEDYLQVSGGYSGFTDTGTESGPGEVGKAAAGYDLQNPVYYPEWDYTRQRYRNEFCALTEVDVAPVDDNFFAATLEKYRFHLSSVRRSFETMAEGYEQRKRQPFGDEVDFDALVEACADRRQGLEMSENLYSCFHRSRRDVAVMFMVDMSGSTRGWVNLVEREALVLLCEALEMLSDPYAIYGFSGRTHKRCEIYRVKKFEEACTALVRGRISGIKPRTYTRMGVAIRHLGKHLQGVKARSRLLITLSDGKPEDYGGYRGRYGMEDTRQAIAEVRADGIYPFCITIDNEAREYLPYMYGSANYTVIDDVRKLPYKVSDIYRRLTT